MSSTFEREQAQSPSEKIKKLIATFSEAWPPPTQILDGLQHVLAETDHMRENLASKEREIELLNLHLRPKTHFGFLFSKNKHLQKLFLMAETCKESNLPVLILGEHGCGKESLARILHMKSLRTGPFIATPFPEAFSPPSALAHTTLYFGDASLTNPSLQKRILEWLPFCPAKNIRIIVSAATGSEIEPELVPHLNSIVLGIPPLRERKEDILPLMDFFIREFSKNEKNISHFSPSTLNKLMEYSWPNNISELKLEVKRILMDYPHRTYFTLETLSEKIIGTSLKDLYTIIHGYKNLPEAVETLEKNMVIESLIKHKGNKSKVSRELGISRSGLIQKIQKYHVLPFCLSKFSETKRRIRSRNSGLMSVN